MKKNILFIAAAAILVAASCSKLNTYPEFSASDSFAAFDKTTISASEDAGRVSIAVTIGSLDPVNTTVTYEVDTENSTAKAGVHFNLVDPSAVLTFADGARTAYIEVDLLPIHGDDGYTGDKVIVFNLLTSNDVKIGSNRVCSFTINDQDHPLAAILGDYTLLDIKGNSWTVTIEKDPDDITVVHVPQFVPKAQTWLGTDGDLAAVGQVSKDLKTIVFALPIDSGYTYSNGENAKLYALDDEGYVQDEVSSLTLTATDTGFASDYGLIGYIMNAGNIGYCWRFTLTKI